ncbi:MAG: hypothetical protein PHQ20_03735 [Candidatus Moranbacteria bacterium]|jgi:hypothetical protein|nr:hypothetical protein [Candidatus Moranbacteria bacterium]
MQENIVKISGGLALMFSVFLLLATTKQLVNEDTLSTRIINNTAEETAPSTIPVQKTELSEKIIRGTFNPNTSGNLIKSYDEKNRILFHYKAISSEKIKKQDLKPVLKLETVSNNQTVWKEIPWSWIDHNQGVLYFHFKTVENGIETFPENYTGKYQLIIE